MIATALCRGPAATQRRATLGFAAVVGILSAATIIAVTGLATPLVFTLPSTVKWGLLVGVPAVALVLACSTRPVTYSASALVIAAPFYSFGFSSPLGHIQLGWALSVVSVLVAFLSARSAGADAVTVGSIQGSRLRRCVPVLILLLLPSGLLGNAVGTIATQAALLAAFCYVLVRAASLDKFAIRIVATSFVLISAIESALALQQYVTGSAFSAYGGAGSTVFGQAYSFRYLDENRPTGTYFDPISLGNTLAIAIPIGFACLFGLRNVALRLLHLAALLVIVAGVTVSLSRTSWIAAVAGTVTVVLLSPGRRRLQQLAALAGGFIMVGSSITTFAGPSLGPRFASILDPTASNVATADGDRLRENLWSRSLSTFTDHPVLGVGIGNLRRLLENSVRGAGDYTHAHSVYLEFLAESGVLGGVAIVALFAAGFTDGRRLLRARTQRWLGGACTGGVVAVAVCWVTDNTMQYTPVLLMMAVPFVFLVMASQGCRQRS